MGYKEILKQFEVHHPDVRKIIHKRKYMTLLVWKPLIQSKPEPVAPSCGQIVPYYQDLLISGAPSKKQVFEREMMRQWVHSKSSA